MLKVAAFLLLEKVAIPEWGAIPAFGGEAFGFQTKGFSGLKGKGKGKTGGANKYPASQKVWVGNLPEGMLQEDVKTFFKQVGDVKFISISGKSNSGVVAYDTDEEAAQAIELLNGQAIDLAGEPIQVDVWTT